MVSASRVYRFRLTGSGRVGGYTLVPGGSFEGLDATGLAASATGAEVAAAIVPGGAAGPSAPADVAVINTRSGARAVWTASKPVRGKVTFPVGDMSLTADGRELVFLASPRCPLGKCKPTGQGEEVRAVSPAARGGRLDSSRILVRQVTLGLAGQQLHRRRGGYPGWGERQRAGHGEPAAAGRLAPPSR